MTEIPIYQTGKIHKCSSKGCETSRDVHLSHFCIFLRIEFQKMRMMVLRTECDFAEKSGQFCDFPRKFRVTSSPTVSQKDYVSVT